MQLHNFKAQSKNYFQHKTLTFFPSSIKRLAFLKFNIIPNVAATCNYTKSLSFHSFRAILRSMRVSQAHQSRWFSYYFTPRPLSDGESRLDENVALGKWWTLNLIF